MSDRIAVMRSGHIEQLGPPESLYERPTTTFVAGFLGVSNLLDGEVVARGSEAADIRLSDGAVVRVPSSILNGARLVHVGIRPEKLRVVATSAGSPVADGSNSLDGTILDASYVGVHTQYLVQTADGHRLTVYAQNLETSGVAEMLSDGEAVRLSWQPQHTFVIGRADASPDSEDQQEEG